VAGRAAMIAMPGRLECVVETLAATHSEFYDLVIRSGLIAKPLWSRFKYDHKIFQDFSRVLCMLGIGETHRSIAEFSVHYLFTIAS
jgi:hypothetical protein